MRNHTVFHLAAGALPFVVLVAAPQLSAAESASTGRKLTFEDRVAVQRAIEQVYWNHRIWPKDNPDLKPALSSVLSSAAIRTEVDDSLRESAALEQLWQRPITPEQLQAEMNRMARDTRDGATRASGDTCPSSWAASEFVTKSGASGGASRGTA